MALNVSVGLRPSGPTSLVSLSICCLMPATRISKNSSRLELKIVRNLTRSMSGWVGSCASSRTRRLNSSQLNSRLVKFSGAEKWEVRAPLEEFGSATTLVGSSGVESSDWGFIAHTSWRHNRRNLWIFRGFEESHVFPVLPAMWAASIPRSQAQGSERESAEQT